MKQEKPYTLRADRNHRICLTMIDKGTDGKYHSASCEYPLIVHKLDADGKLVMVKKTRKQIIEYLYSIVAPYYADGKSK